MSEEDRVLILLRDARFILSDAVRWSRGFVLARTREGTACAPIETRARMFNVCGALERALFERGYVSALLDGAPARTLLTDAKTRLSAKVDWRVIDEVIERAAARMTHAELLRWFDSVIDFRLRESAAAVAAEVSR